MKRFFTIILPAAFIFLTIGAPASVYARSLYLGLSGDDVTVLQRALIAKGYLNAAATGYFGPLTKAAVEKFQCDTGIICAHATISGYGIYGPRTQTALTGSTSGVAGKSSFEISGWIPYWRSATGTADTLPHLNKLASVMPFGYTMKNDGTVADTAHLSEEPWKSFIAEAKKQSVRVVPTVMWGNGDAIHTILSNSTTRVALEDEIANLVKQNDWDGIDIDFEAKKHETIDYFSTFLKGLYQRMGKKWVYCTVEARMPLSHRYSPGAAIPPDATDYANDYDEMNKYCDRIEIMAYDQGTIDVYLNSIRPAPYAPVSDPAWVEALVSMATKSIPKNKLIIGIPTYGYEYNITSISGSDYQYKVLWPFNPRYASDLASLLHATPARTSAGEAGFVYYANALTAVAPTGTDYTDTQQAMQTKTTVVQNADGTATAGQPINFITWSDAQAIADKVALARKLGVRGVAVFKFDGSQDPGMWDVLK